VTRVLLCAVRHWSNDHAASLGAALAFYCAFSLGPLLVLIVTIAGWIVGAEAAHSYLGAQLTALFGAASAHLLLDAMRSSQSGAGALAGIVSAVTLLIGATTVFAALETAFEEIWGPRAGRTSGWRGFLRTRLVSLGLVLAIGFLLLVSLAVTTALAALRGYLLQRHAIFVALAAAAEFLVSVSLIAGLIAAIYRYMTPVRLAWRDIARGALTTALLFHLGRWGIGLYLGRATQPSAFGAAASFVVLLLWLYYSAQIFLLGAEFTACLGGSHRGARETDPAIGAQRESARTARKPARHAQRGR
jgi:membrane protein